MIETDRLLLRAKTLADVPPLAVIRADPDYARHLSGHPATLGQVRASVERDIDHQARVGFSMWTAVLARSGEVIGDIGLQLFEWTGPEVEIGWRLARAYWGHGYATEGGRAAWQLAFDRFGLDRVIAVAQPANAASIRVMEKLGMTFEAACVAYGRPCVRYAIVR